MAAAGVGFCGALTTYSTFGYETLRLAQDRAWFYAAANTAASILAGLGTASCGLTLAQRRQLGWIVHLINEVFPNDAQETADEDWIAYGVQRGWGLLSKDKKIRFRADELLALSEQEKLFCLSNGNLLARAQAETFERAREQIERALQRHGAAVPGVPQR